MLTIFPVFLGESKRFREAIRTSFWKDGVRHEQWLLEVSVSIRALSRQSRLRVCLLVALSSGSFKPHNNQESSGPTEDLHALFDFID